MHKKRQQAGGICLNELFINPYLIPLGKTTEISINENIIFEIVKITASISNFWWTFPVKLRRYVYSGYLGFIISNCVVTVVSYVALNRVSLKFIDYKSFLSG